MKVVPVALGAVPEKKTLFVERLTGQNSTFVPQFDVFRPNEAEAFLFIGGFR